MSLSFPVASGIVRVVFPVILPVVRILLTPPPLGIFLVQALGLVTLHLHFLPPTFTRHLAISLRAILLIGITGSEDEKTSAAFTAFLGHTTSMINCSDRLYFEGKKNEWKESRRGQEKSRGQCYGLTPSRGVGPWPEADYLCLIPSFKARGMRGTLKLKAGGAG
jgi:hypothetical protein